MFCYRVEDTEVHTLPHPKPALMVLPDQIHIVITQRGRIIRIAIKRTKTVAVITVQTIGSTHPDDTFRVLEEVVDL